MPEQSFVCDIRKPLGRDFSDRIDRAASQLGLQLKPAQTSALVRYLNLLTKWSRVYNLTALRDAEEMLTHHIFDSLAVVAPMQRKLCEMGTTFLAAETSGAGASKTERSALVDDDFAADSLSAISWRLLDVGSGAGLPGVVLAVCCPWLSVTCVDAVAKKAAFVQQVAVDLRLSNLQSVHARAESMNFGPPDEGYDVICSRAFASLTDFTRLTAAVLKPGGLWMALKGKLPEAEMKALQANSVGVFHVEQLEVPMLQADRCIVWMRKLGDSGKPGLRPA